MGKPKLRRSSEDELSDIQPWDELGNPEEQEWTLHETECDIHVFPTWELRHTMQSDCYCCPIVDKQDPFTLRRVYKHNSREEAC